MSDLVDLKEQARQLYMSHKGATFISKSLSLPRSTVNSWINQTWKEERQLHQIETFQEFKAKKAPQLMEILDKSGDVINRFINDLLHREEAPKAWELNYVFKSMEVLDKIYRLETNQPTNIVQEEKAMDAVELVKKIKASDPFSKIDEVVYEEK